MLNIDENSRKIKAYFCNSRPASKASDKIFDDLLMDSTDDLFQTALDKVDLTSEDCIKEPVIIIGPPNMGDIGDLEFYFKKGVDNFLRYIPLGITIYNFTRHALVAYQCTFDPTTKASMNECTFEYFYNEIVSFETISESSSSIEFDLKAKIIKRAPHYKNVINTGKVIQKDQVQKFILTTSGSSSLSVTLTENFLKEASNGGKFSQSNTHKSISEVRKTIRDKKNHTMQTLRPEYVDKFEN